LDFFKPEAATRNPQLETRNSKPETRNPKLETPFSMSDSSDSPAPNVVPMAVPTGSVAAVADAVGDIANLAAVHEQNLAIAAGRANTAVMQAAALAEEATQSHNDFVTALAKAKAGDKSAWAQVQAMLSSVGLVCLLLVFALQGGCSSTATVVPPHAPPAKQASFSDDGQQDSGAAQLLPDGNALVTQGLKDNYARLIKKFGDGADPQNGFTPDGQAANGTPLYEVRLDVLSHYHDLLDAENSGVAPVK
jgi:hypothetical protein